MLGKSALTVDLTADNFRYELDPPKCVYDPTDYFVNDVGNLFQRSC